MVKRKRQPVFHSGCRPEAHATPRVPFTSGRRLLGLGRSEAHTQGIPVGDELPLSLSTLIAFRQRRREPFLPCKILGERNDSGVTTQIHQGHLNLQGGLKAASHGIQQPRIPSKIVEVIMQADMVNLQNIPPNFGDGFGKLESSHRHVSLPKGISGEPPKWTDITFWHQMARGSVRWFRWVWRASASLYYNFQTVNKAKTVRHSPTFLSFFRFFSNGLLTSIKRTSHGRPIK